jgi:RNA polymerase sigma factor (sigma-70 family)
MLHRSDGDTRDSPFVGFDFETLLQPLLKYACSRVRNTALAEDAVSETLLAALQTERTFSSEGQAVAWTYGVLRHKLVDELRRQGRDGNSPGDSQEPDQRLADGADCNEPEQICIHRQLRERVERVCRTLPQLQRQAFVMRELLGHEPDAICRQLAISESHLWVLVFRARTRLRQVLTQSALGSRNTNTAPAPA